MAQRLDAAILLSEGYSYQKITEMVEISTATIGRVSKCLNYGSGGYRAAIEKLKALGGTMSFENLYHEEFDDDGVVEDYEDMRPQIIVANRHCVIDWTIVLSVRLDDDDVIRVTTDDYGEIPVTYAEGETYIYIYKAILYN